MKAALCKRLEGPEGIEIEDIAAPRAGDGRGRRRGQGGGAQLFRHADHARQVPGEARAAVLAGGRGGGRRGGGGAGVNGVRVGDRVMAYIGWGGAREKIVAPASALVPIPDGVSDAVAAGVSVTYGTAIHGLKDRAQLQAGRDAWRCWARPAAPGLRRSRSPS